MNPSIFEHRFTQFFTLSPQLLAIATPDGILREINPAWCKVLGYSKEKVISTPFLSFIDPIDKPRLLQDFELLLQAGKIEDCEHRIVTRSGERRNLLWNGVHYKDENLLYIAAHDVTDDRQAERALQLQYDLIHATAKCQTLEEAAKEIIETLCGTFEIRIGIFWHYDALRQKLLFHTGFSLPSKEQKEELFLAARKNCQFTSGFSLPEKVISSKQFEWLSNIQQEIDIEIASIAAELSLKSGFAFPIQANGEFMGILEFFSDREDRKLSLLGSLFYAIGNNLGQFAQKQRAEKREALLASIVESAETAIYSQDRSGLILTWNHGAEKLYGFTQEEMLGKTPDCLCQEYSSAEWKNILLQVEQKNKVDNYETIRKKKGGAPLEVALFSSAIMDEKGNHIGFSTLSYDISERKRLETMKNEFISIVSHELRTPLTSITGSIKLLLSGKKGELPEESTKLLHIASRNGERLARLINDILDLEKIESGKMIFNIATIDMTLLVKTAIENNRPIANSRNIGIELEEAPPQAFAIGDPDRVCQVVTNLLSNAIKFSPSEGSIHVVIAEENNEIRVMIRDEGTGIPHHERAKLFQKFSQIDSADNRKKEGSGLGLSISKMIIENLGGSIGFTSEQDEGTTFFFTLPVSKVPTKVS